MSEKIEKVDSILQSERSGDSEEAGGVQIYQLCFLTDRRSLRKDSKSVVF